MIPNQNPMPDRNAFRRSPWTWVPTVYFAEGLPYVLVTVVSAILYKNLGLSNTRAALYTSWLYLPWVIKPFWSPLVEKLRTRRWWIWAMQVCGGAGLAGLALTVPTTHFLQLTLALFWLMAFSSATHDIAADGFYILANTEYEQAFFSGVRNVSFNLAKIAAQGLLVALAGVLKERTGGFVSAWAITMAFAAGIFLSLAAWHRFILPRPAGDVAGVAGPSNSLLEEFPAAFADFFRKPGIITLLCFLLLYRFGEAQLVKMATLFLIDPRDRGGLGLDNQQLSLAYSTAGVIALICGGLLGGFVISRRGLKFWLWPMALAIHLPDAVYVWLAYAQPRNLFVISAGVAVEQFGYGFGFAAYMLYMIYIARGKHQTAHYAICTGFMALGMMLPGMWSGWLADTIGYQHFFVWVLLATIPGFAVTALIPLDAEFGRRAA
jgi:MFS transporter, PAT family, beta-lactamase induction signal transducer AmpG